MRIGIDISQIAYEGTGVGEYLRQLVEELLNLDRDNEYVLFFSSLRRKIQNSKFKIQNDNPKVKITTFLFPPVLLDLLWNRLHIFPIEWLIGNVDVFISSDWTQPPTKAKRATILYDLIVYMYPEGTDKKIVSVQKRRLSWVKKECDIVFCISESTKKDAKKILGIDQKKLHVIYPGV
ncbi:MAG: glycosyltransferase [Candidatus Levybacteria bacterium]|nr:glycosyltransferase [Candidatus Levybacteria bacterium]